MQAPHNPSSTKKIGHLARGKALARKIGCCRSAKAKRVIRQECTSVKPLTTHVCAGFQSAPCDGRFWFCSGCVLTLCFGVVCCQVSVCFVSVTKFVKALHVCIWLLQVIFDVFPTSPRPLPRQDLLRVSVTARPCPSPCPSVCVFFAISDMLPFSFPSSPSLLPVGVLTTPSPLPPLP